LFSRVQNVGSEYLEHCSQGTRCIYNHFCTVSSILFLDTSSTSRSFLRPRRGHCRSLLTTNSPLRAGLSLPFIYLLFVHCYPGFYYNLQFRDQYSANMKLLSVLLTSLLTTLTTAQLSGSVGPTTSLASKQAKKTCTITAYGATSGSDVGPALLAAWKDCKAGGVVVVPSGTWTISTWVLLNGGSGWALQLDGTIIRDTSVTTGGNMIFIEHTSDVEVFSSTGAGAILGEGYEMHKTGSISGPRLLRFYDVVS